jgi:hypothetical protein
MNAKRLLITTIFLLLSIILITACSPDPEIIVVEVTRLVEVQKEVTRIVEVSPDTVLPPGVSVFAPDLEFLQVEFWPDYDKPAVLVLLTGRLPVAQSLPAEVAIPIPQEAQINAIAQIDEGGMASIDYRTADGAVLFQSASPAFRVEYYVPYQLQQTRRDYEFQWLAPFSVYEMTVQVQRPANTADLAIQPQPSAVFTDNADGLDYYELNSLSVPRGIPYNLNFSYTMPSDSLTIDELSPASPDGPLHNNQQASRDLGPHLRRIADCSPERTRGSASCHLPLHNLAT